MMISLKKLTLTTFLFLSPIFLFSQKGKDLSPTIASGPPVVVNAYTRLTGNATIGATSLMVNNNTLSGPYFVTGNLQAGDLILIIQMQGASIDVDATPTTGWGGQYTVPSARLWTYDWYNYSHEWGQITAYNNAGKFEYAEVRSVVGLNTINLQCPLQNSYTATGRVQIVRVPRFQDLTLSSNAIINSTPWDFNNGYGGIVAIEVNGNLVMNNNSVITTSGQGFRGGVADNVGLTGSNTVFNPTPPPAGNVGNAFLGSNTNGQGARKGEGIAGYTTEYSALYSIYGRGSAANGGGGGGIQNGGGGGGSNIGSGNYTGKGVPNTSYNAAWNQENAGFGGSSSSGGGRGGYSYSNTNQNAATTGPNNTAWNGDARKVNGGLGGHPLTYDATRLFMGGGGGAGDQDSGQGGAGGNGGGVVCLTVYGTISGNGTIEANGANGQKTNPGNQSPQISPSSAQRKGNDGAGGAGAGGSIFVKNSSAIPSSINLNAIGGTGGNVALTFYFGSATHEGNGPGGGGGGGAIAFTSGTPTQNVNGGASGTTNSDQLTEMPVNGATNAANGVSSLTTAMYNITPNNITACQGSPMTVSVSTTGTLPGTLQWFSTYTSNTVLGTGTSYTPSPAPSVTTTYYVSVCPGTFRVPVTITVQPAPTISGTANITNAGCTTPGAITGLSASGGTGTLTYTWNGASSPSTNLSNASAGSYTLVVTDANGCTATSGPHNIGGTSAPSINSSTVVVNNELCNGTLGSISGITASGGTGSLTYSWSPSGGSSLNASGLSQGAYTLTVTDGVGCTANAGPFNVGFTSGPSIDESNVVISNETCGNANGSINGITANGTSLSYLWTNSGGSAINITSAPAGTYTLTVTDGNGCTASSSALNIANIAGPTIDISNVTIADDHCNQGIGTIGGIVVNGGTAPLSYSWDNTAQTTLNINNLSANTFNLTVSDANGCQATAGPFTINNLAGPSINETNVLITDVSCAGTLGTITGLTTNPSSGVTYQWNVPTETNLDASNLAAGTYFLTVTDAFNCTSVSSNFTVDAATQIVIDDASLNTSNSSCTTNDGSIQGLTYSGGTNPTFSWSSGQSTLDINSLAPGTYTLTVSDAFGCSDQYNVNIGTVNGPIIDTTNMLIVDAHCSQNDGSISGITVSAGTPTYSYQWNTIPSANTLSVINIVSGTYTLTVTDAAGCTDTETITLNEIAGPVINDNGLQVVQPTCLVAGQINGLVATGASALTYAWQGSTQTTIDLSNVNAGTFNLTATDANGCSATYGPIVLNAPSGPTADFTWTPQVPNIGDQITFDNTSTGNNLTYSWDINVTGNPNFNTENIQYAFDSAGVYEVTLTVTDQNGCIDEIIKMIEVYNEMQIPNVITMNNDGVNDVFFIKGLKPKTSLIVIDRWGLVVCNAGEYLNDWNGTDVSGKMLTGGVYTYKITTEDNKVFTGFLHIIR